MLTRERLVELYNTSSAENVLSVYINGAFADPATQRTWRIELDHRLKDIRVWLAESPHVERGPFESCVQLLEKELDRGQSPTHSPGWAAFITVKGVQHAGPLPVVVSTQAVWGTGCCVAPYMRALKETRPVIVAVADSRKTDLYRYALGELQGIATFNAHHVVDEPLHMNAPPKPGFHSGTRGTAGRDMARDALRAGTDRMISEVVEGIRTNAGGDSWILLGGIQKIVAQLAQELPAEIAARAMQLDALDVHDKEVRIADAARSGASLLRNALDIQKISEIANLANAKGLGVVGVAGTAQALEQACVQELFLTPRYLADHPAAAEDFVRSALAQDAGVEELSNTIAEPLDALGGVGARLRYRFAETEALEVAGERV